MTPCHRLQSSVSSSRSQACPCTQTKVAQEGVAPSQSWSEFFFHLHYHPHQHHLHHHHLHRVDQNSSFTFTTNTFITITLSTTTTIHYNLPPPPPPPSPLSSSPPPPSQIWSVFTTHQHLFKSHHMESESLFFNLIQVFWNWVVPSKLLVHQIIFRKASLALFRSLQSFWTSLRGLVSWERASWRGLTSSGGIIDEVTFCQDQHVVHPRSWACLGHLGKEWKRRGLSIICFIFCQQQ